MKPAIIIPVYNHGSRIGEVVEKSVRLGLPIFVVDDGSTDDTCEVLAGLSGIDVLRHSENQGKGAALLTGFAAAVENGHDWAVTIDGDGQHVPADAGNLLQAVREGERCIVIGSRQGMDDNVHVPWTSRFGRGFSNFWVRAAGGPMVSDSQSGFRLYPLPESLQLGVKARRYQFEVEILVRAHRRGIRAKETPIGVVYQPKGVRISHFRPWRDFLRNSSTFNRLIWDRIFSVFFPRR